MLRLDWCSFRRRLLLIRARQLQMNDTVVHSEARLSWRCGGSGVFPLWRRRCDHAHSRTQLAAQPVRVSVDKGARAARPRAHAARADRRRWNIAGVYFAKFEQPVRVNAS